METCLFIGYGDTKQQARADAVRNAELYRPAYTGWTHLRNPGDDCVPGYGGYRYVAYFHVGYESIDKAISDLIMSGDHYWPPGQRVNGSADSTTTGHAISQ